MKFYDSCIIIILQMLQERGVMTGSNQVMVVRPNPSFTRRLAESSFVLLPSVIRRTSILSWKLTGSCDLVMVELMIERQTRFFLICRVPEQYVSAVVCPQAKTTKKIVLRLACQSCKHVTQHPIKVTFSFNFIIYCQISILGLWRRVGRVLLVVWCQFTHVSCSFLRSFSNRWVQWWVFLWLRYFFSVRRFGSD